MTNPEKDGRYIMKIWVLTAEYNEYDQYGEYYIKSHKEKFTREELKKLIIVNDATIDHILEGGGRREYENQWYWLREEEI